MRIALSYRLLVLGFALHAATRPLPAQVVSSGASAEETQRRTYGTADTIIQQIPSAAFQLRSGDDHGWLRRRELLPEPERDARRDGGLPGSRPGPALALLGIRQ